MIDMGGYGSGRQSQLPLTKETTYNVMALDVRLKRQGSLTKSSRFSFEIKSGIAKVSVGSGRTNWKSDLGEEAGRLLCLSEGGHVNLIFPTHVGSNRLALPKKTDYSSSRGYKVVDQQIQLTATPCALGGHRLWWRCPCCDARVAILYLRLVTRPNSEQKYRGQDVSGATGENTCHLWGRGFFACRRCLDLVYTSQYQSAGERSRDRATAIRIRLGATIEQIISGVRILNKPKGMHYKAFFRLTNEALWRDEVFLAEVHQQFARYDMLIQAERIAEIEKRAIRLQRKAQQLAARPPVKRTNTVRQVVPIPKPSAPFNRSDIGTKYWRHYAPIVHQKRTDSRRRPASVQKQQGFSTSMPTIRVSSFKIQISNTRIMNSKSSLSHPRCH